MRGPIQPDFGQAPAADASLGGVFAALNRRKWWILMATTMAFVATAAFVNIVTPSYTGEARLLLENRDNYFTRPDRDSRGAEPSIDAEAVQSQVQLILSRDIARAVIKKLDLSSKEEFDSARREASSLKRLLAIAGLAKDPLASSPEERVLEAYMDKLLVVTVGKSRVISVSFSSKDPDLAARAANTVADEYIRFQGDAKKSTTQGASAWLSQTIETLRAKVAEAEAKVENYRAANGLLIGSSNATITTQQLGEMNTQISNARSAQSDLQAKARLIREALKNGRIFETSDVVNNELIRRLLEQRVAMKTQIALEERTLLPGHPRMKELTAQLNDLEGQIRTAAERTARTLENDARVAGARMQSLQAEFEGQKRTAADANGSEVQLRALEREARALRDNYESYLAKYRDSLSRDSDAASPADARIFSRAIVPQKPAFPKKLPMILLATLATLILSCAMVVTRQVFMTDPAGEIMPPAMVDPHGRFVAPEAPRHHPGQFQASPPVADPSFNPQPAWHPAPPAAPPAAARVREPQVQAAAPPPVAEPPVLAPEQAAERLQAT
ncbi:MAG TPA: GumC family protein, partial [Beijerinckiaceae bacterium]|nr:GumC family protein [Beijerinckiaceae bacterium]